MIEYTTDEKCFENDSFNSVHSDIETKLSLTKLWDFILRTKRLPDGSNVTSLYNSVRDKLRDPEREVRQHALRVLVDLIPVTQTLTLDNHMRELVPELLSNLGHSAPALRKSALDSLRKYLQHSRNYDEILMTLVSKTENNVIAAAPFLISSDTGDQTLSHVIDQLWMDLGNARLNQEVTAKSLARIRYILGDEKFRILVGTGRYNEIEKICDSYGIPISFNEYGVDKMPRNNDGEMEDKVILETEITLKTGPAITMKIHEESLTSGDENAIQSSGILGVIEDESESDFYESARRTPRKVRFGGESVKLRTPESDNSQNDDHRGTIRITVTDAVSIKTRRSLIPIRITSLPSSPRKSFQNSISHRLHKSTPNLYRDRSNSKIPLKKNSNITGKFKKPSGNEKDSPIYDQNSYREPNIRHKTNNLNSAPTKPKTVGSISPHKEIEVFHNLTRSPERINKPSTQTLGIQLIVGETQEIQDVNKYNSFEVCTEAHQMSLGEKCSQTENIQSDEQISDTGINRNESNSVQIRTDAAKVSISGSTTSIDRSGECGEKLNFNNSTYKTNTYSNYDQELIVEDSSNFFSQPLMKDEIRAGYDISKSISANMEDCYDSFQVYSGEGSLSENENETICVSSLISKKYYTNETEALVSLTRMLKQPGTCETLEPDPSAVLFETLFSYEQMDENHFLANEALVLMIRGLRVEVLQKCLGRLAIGLAKMGSPAGVGLALMILKKCEAKQLQNEILNKCFAHKLREGALQILMAAASVLPTTDILVNKIIEFAASALRDRRRRVRHAALETLAILASLSSNADVTNIVDTINSTAPDHDYLVRVVRTRLSRPQLPAVEVNGTVLYSAPVEQTELEWLSELHVNPSSSSSASSSQHSVNYWKHNSRHEGSGVANKNVSSHRDDSASGNQTIWAVDSSGFPRNIHDRNNSKGGPTVLRPVYFLQPEAATQSGRGHRRHDRGRSFSPHKPYRKQVREVVDSTSQHHANVDYDTTQQPEYSEGFRKSFSSEQLHYSGKRQQEPQSLSSGSSTSSTGLPIKSSSWQREMRTGIPIPIASGTKIRLRTGGTSNNNTVGPVIARSKEFKQKAPHKGLSCRTHSGVEMCNNNVVNPWGLRETISFKYDISKCCPCFLKSRKVVDISDTLLSRLSTPVLTITTPPEPKEKSAIGTTILTPTVTPRLSPRHNEDYNNESRVLTPPSRSAGSESSGYFTPPSESRAFVKLDSEWRSTDSEEKDGSMEHDRNNNSQNDLDLPDNIIQPADLRGEADEVDFEVMTGSYDNKKVSQETQESEKLTENNVQKENSTEVRRFSISSSKELPYVCPVPSVMERQTKSRSVVDLQSFLPEIPKRKSTSSAPPLKDDLLAFNDLIITSYEDVTVHPDGESSKEVVVLDIEVDEAVESSKEIKVTRKLSRRLSRTPSRRSIKSTPRSGRDSTPKNAGIKPKEILQIALAQLNDQEWEVMIQGLQGLTKVARNNPDVIEANIHNVCVGLARHIKNLRSQVARTACHTASEIFGSCKKGLDVELEEIAGPLLHRTADTNKFLRADANAALDVMCEQLPAGRVIAVITSRGCNHQNNIVRSASMRLLTNIVRKLGADKIFQMNKDSRDRILIAGANSLGDGSLETRNHGKVLLSYLINHPQFQRVLLETIPQNTLRHIAKTLNSIKPHTGT